MRKIPKENYIKLIIILFITMFLTIGLSKLYINLNTKENEFYEFSNKIESKDFEQYSLENDNYIIYISNMKDENVKKFETKLKEKIINENLRDKYIYLEKRQLNKNVKNKLNDMNVKNFKLEYNNYPIFIFVNEKEITNVAYVDLDNYNINDIFSVEVVKW